MAMISTCSRCGREYEGEDACDHSTPEIEIGACYRDERDGEIVRVLGPEQRLLGFPAVVLKAGESAGHGAQAGARVWRDRDALTERVSDPTPAIVEDSAEGVEPDDLDLDQAADLKKRANGHVIAWAHSLFGEWANVGEPMPACAEAGA